MKRPKLKGRALKEFMERAGQRLQQNPVIDEPLPSKLALLLKRLVLKEADDLAGRDMIVLNADDSGSWSASDFIH